MRSARGYMSTYLMEVAHGLLAPVALRRSRISRRGDVAASRHLGAGLRSRRVLQIQNGGGSGWIAAVSKARQEDVVGKAFFLDHRADTILLGRSIELTGGLPAQEGG